MNRTEFFRTQICPSQADMPAVRTRVIVSAPFVESVARCVCNRELTSGHDVVFSRRSALAAPCSSSLP